MGCCVGIYEGDNKGGKQSIGGGSGKRAEDGNKMVGIFDVRR
jgi:hypothetical protein